jgi:hypothetical protein
LSLAATQRMYSEQDPIAATGALVATSRAFDDAGMSLQRVETRESSLRPDGLREVAIDIAPKGTLWERLPRSRRWRDKIGSCA